jgi:hypothetical protein
VTIQRLDRPIVQHLMARSVGLAMQEQRMHLGCNSDAQEAVLTGWITIQIRQRRRRWRISSRQLIGGLDDSLRLCDSSICGVDHPLHAPLHLLYPARARVGRLSHGPSFQKAQG